MTRLALALLALLLAYAVLLDDAVATRYCAAKHSPATCAHMLNR